ncbi:MAG: aspartate-semialdehyde dehydrogenase [Candidatus Thorarchaeota archaeon]|nr:aspartate-semialdehyde dehydrogenase [Candidatus Thorarchaeota archaeon]
MNKIRCCILGATGLVGQQFVRLLSGHPYFEVSMLTASESSVGKTYEEATEWVVGGEMPANVRALEVSDSRPESVLDREVSLAFCALPASIASDIEVDLAKSGVHVFSNASAHRMDGHTPILIPDINPEHLRLVRKQPYGRGFIVTNSNCSTSGLVFGLRPLMSFGIRYVNVTTYQAVSGAGRRGVASMDILGNVIPFIAQEEEKIERESRKILGVLDVEDIRPAQFEIDASCARVPVMNGHLESVTVNLEQDVSIEDARAALMNYTEEPQRLRLPTAPPQPIVVVGESDRPQPARDLHLEPPHNGMAVVIGRLRKKQRRLSFFLLVNNTIRGAAGASVLNAEFAMAKGYLNTDSEVSECRS